MALVAYGALVPRPLLGALPWLNLHPSALPRWRGAAPIERALIAGEEQLAVCVMQLVEALDAGPLAAVEPFPAGPDETAGDVYERALEPGIGPLASALAAAAAGGLATIPQLGEATYAAKLTAADRRLDPLEPARRLHDRVRALSPHVGARIAFGEHAFTLWRTHLEPASGAAPGTVWRHGERLLLACADGEVEVAELQPPGRARMPAQAWLRGWRGPLPPAARLP
jgi:methionyl-tRNA formyltransferase